MRWVGRWVGPHERFLDFHLLTFVRESLTQELLDHQLRVLLSGG